MSQFDFCINRQLEFSLLEIRLVKLNLFVIKIEKLLTDCKKSENFQSNWDPVVIFTKKKGVLWTGSINDYGFMKNHSSYILHDYEYKQSSRANVHEDEVHWS